MSSLPTGGAAPREHGGARRRNRAWVVVAWGIVVVGLTVSAVGALMWRASERHSQRQAFESTSANVTATLGTLPRRDTDFVATLRAVLTMHPRMAPTMYSTWYATLLHYQPTVALDSESVTGVEALLRWRHPERGVIAPDVFHPAG